MKARAWRRPAVAGLGLLVLVNLAVVLVFTLPRGLAERSLEARVRTLQAEVETRRQELERVDRRQRLLADNGRDAQRIVERLVGTREATLATILSELETSARELGLTLGSRNMQPEDVDDTPLTRLQIALPVEGPYRSLVAFLRRLEHSQRFITVDEMRLSGRAKSGQEHTTALDLSLSVYLRAVPGESKAGSGAR